MQNLYENLGEMKFDNLISDTIPTLITRGKTIRSTDAETTYVRGTLFGVSSADEKLVVYGSTAAEGEKITPHCILCDDVTVGTDEDVTTVCYIQGCFNPDKVTVASGYELTEADMVELAKFNILFKSMLASV